ncbi:MAG: ABC transporter substrate-binding protein [Thaumarchaeota archaeon]|nr:ABC transporter substrate-binding protein [Nitrososphaerota archaeon]
MVSLFSEVLGLEVKLPDRPKRIVSFSPAATETLFMLGLGDDVVGVSAFCARPPEAKTKRRVGSYNTVRREVLDDLAPDLVLTVTGYQREFAVELSKKYPVYPLELPLTVAGIVDFVVKVGLVAGAQEAARELGSALLGLVARVSKVKKATAYVEIDLGGPVTFGAHSYITDAIRLVGCSSLYENERVEWLKPNLESVGVWDPDVIIYEPKMYTKFGSEDLRELVRARKWEGLRAVREGRTFVTPGPLDFLAHHGPSFVTEALPWLERSLGAAGRSQGT